MDEEEQAYGDLADELNDIGIPMTIEDFHKGFVARAKKFADERQLPWPPSTGDYDRYWEAKIGDPCRRDTDGDGNCPLHRYCSTKTPW